MFTAGNTKHSTTRVLAIIGLAIAFLGCPNNAQIQYDLGFGIGFIQDTWYWDGYFDGEDTVDDSQVYYDASEIQFIDELGYDAGYWDGIWYAYNDGYFVDYHYGFIVGFSEGYDAAFYPDFLDFLDADIHVEYGNGGWGDGYNDGFSEGRVFGANDYEQDLPFDWADALADYASGTDLYFDEVDVGTGALGPVVLYEYGTDPTAKALDTKRMTRKLKTIPAVRADGATKAIDIQNRQLYRPFSQDAINALDVRNATVPRNNHNVRVEGTYLDRIEAYFGIGKTLHGKSLRQRQVD